MERTLPAVKRFPTPFAGRSPCYTRAAEEWHTRFPRKFSHRRIARHERRRATMTTQTTGRGLGTETRMRPSQAVVAGLRAHGVDTIFGLDFNHVIYLIGGRAAAPAIRPTTSTHETTTASAPD